MSSVTGQLTNLKPITHRHHYPEDETKDQPREQTSGGTHAGEDVGSSRTTSDDQELERRTWQQEKLTAVG